MPKKIQFKLIHTGTLSVPNGSIGTGSTHISPKYIEWYQGNDDKEVTVICNDKMLDKEFVSSIKGIKIAWLVSEPFEIIQTYYNNIESMKTYFDYIFTHDIRFVDNKKVLFCSSAGHWINDKQIYPKNRLLSVIASDKNYMPGHIMRHQIIKKHHKYFDGVFGRGYNIIVDNDKTIGLRDYCFHLVIENVKRDFWITEKLIDSFVTGCLPIYWGCPSIDKYFDKRGMIIIDKIEDLDEVFKEYLTPVYYKSCLEYIEKNFKIAMNDFLTPEDFMFKNIFEIKHE